MGYAVYRWVKWVNPKLTQIQLFLNPNLLILYQILKSYKKLLALSNIHITGESYFIFFSHWIDFLIHLDQL